MRRTERLTERAITFAIAEPDEDLAVARLAFLARGDHPALDAAIDACLARRDRSLRTRWRAISLLVRVQGNPQRQLWRCGSRLLVVRQRCIAQLCAAAAAQPGAAKVFGAPSGYASRRVGAGARLAATEGHNGQE